MPQQRPRRGAAASSVIALVSASIALGATPAEPPRIEPDAARADAEVLIAAFRDLHPGYTRYRTLEDASQSEARLREASERCRNHGELYLAVQRYLAEIRCEHTEAEPSAALWEWRNARPTMLPIDFEMVEGRAIVVGVAPSISGVERGDEILSIDGRSMGDVRDALAPYISVDGDTTSTRSTLFAGVDDVGLTTFDMLFPLLYGFGDGFDLVLERADGTRRSVRVPPVDESASRAARGATKEFADFSDAGAVEWELVEGRVALLRVSTFVNYRHPVDPASVLAPVFAEINASGAERLVLDLRGVGGGSGDVQMSLLTHLIDRPIRTGGPSRVRTYDFSAHRANLRTWTAGAFDMPAELFTRDETGMLVVDPAVAGGERTIEPAPNAWRGELVVLIGPNNESGATMMLAELREQRKVTYIGEPTGGSAEGPTAGVIAFLTLPSSGIVARLPLVWSRTAAARFEPNLGVATDVRVSPSVADVRSGRDAALEAALRPRLTTP